MRKIRFFTDEDVYGILADLLARAGHDALSTPAANRRGESDESQLIWAADQKRVLVTFNVADFARLHHAWLENGRKHCGVVVTARCSIRVLRNRLLRLAEALTQEAMANRLEYLSNW